MHGRDEFRGEGAPRRQPREQSLTITNASEYGQAVGLVWWRIGMVFAAIYSIVIYRMFRGKVRLEDEGY